MQHVCGGGGRGLAGGHAGNNAEEKFWTGLLAFLLAFLGLAALRLDDGDTRLGFPGLFSAPLLRHGSNSTLAKPA